MKKRNVRLFAFLLAVLLALPCGAFAAESKAVDGAVHIVSDPAGADVYVDGALYAPAVTPCDIPMEPGTHSISVRMAGYDAYETTVRAGQSVEAHLRVTIPDGPNVRTITVNRDDHGIADARILNWEYYERFLLNGESRPETEWYEGQPQSDYYPEWAYDALTDGVSLREALCIAENDTGWFDEENQIRWYYVIEFAAEKLNLYGEEGYEPNVYYQGGSFTCYGRGTAAWINGEPLFMRYTEEGLVEDTAAKSLWNGDGCFTINGDRDRDGVPDVTLAGIEETGWNGRQGLSLLCSDIHVVGLDFATTMHVSMGKPFWQPLNYFNVRDFYITGCRFSRDSGEQDLPDRFFGTGICQIYGETAEGYGQTGTYDLDGFYLTGCEFQNELVGFIFSGSDMDYARAKNLVIQGNHIVNGEIFVRNQDAHTWYMWPNNGEMSGTAYGEDCIGVAEYNILEDVTISGNRIEYTADAIPQVGWDAGYGSTINIGNSNLGGSHNTMRNVTVRCNTSRLEQANIDAYQNWPNAGIRIENAAVGDGKDDGYDGELASSLCEVSDNLFEGLTIEYNDFQINFFDVENISLVGTAQTGTNNVFRDIRIANNQIDTVLGLHFSGADGNSNLGCVAEGAMENVTVCDNTIRCVRKTGWSADSNINTSGEQEDYGIRLVGASVADYDGSGWNENGEKQVWDGLTSAVSDFRIERNRVMGFANGILVAAAECKRTHYITGIAVDDVTITDNEIATDGVNKNCRNDGIALFGAIDGGTNCLLHHVDVSRNRVTAANGLLAAGFYSRGTSRCGVRDNQVLHVNADDNQFSFTDPRGYGAFPIVTADAVCDWGEIPYALGETAVVLTESGNTDSGYPWKSLKLAKLSLRETEDETAFLEQVQSACDAAIGREYINWTKDSFTEPCQTPLFMGVCDKPEYRPGGCHRYYLTPCNTGVTFQKGSETGPSCTEPGTYEETVSCALCGEELYKETKEGDPALGHTFVNGVCTRCGEKDPGNTQPTEPTNAPTEPTAAPTEPTTAPTEPTTAPTEPTTAPTEPTTAPTEPTTAPTEPTTAPTEPTTAPTEPTTAPTEPTTAPTEPTTAPTEPTTAPTEPTTEPTEPTEQDKPCDGGKECPSYAFRDVNYGDWYHEAVDFAVKRGLFKGMTDTTFEPNTAMTRGMLVTVLWRYENSPEEGTNSFADVKPGEWYEKAVAWAAEHGIVTGVGNNRFDPNGRITREQMAAILYRYSAYKNYDTDKRGNLNAFPDAAKVSSYAHDAYAWAVGEGLITGNKLGGQTLLDPQGNATRAQVATILMRFIEKIAK